TCGSPSTSPSATPPSSTAPWAWRPTTRAPASSPWTSWAASASAATIVHFVGEKTHPGALATCGYDDDGVKTTAWPMVRAGVFVDYQSTREQAHLIGR